MNLPALVFLLCLATSLVCAGLLLRGFRKSGSRLLLWVGLGFCAISLNSAFLVADLVLFREVDLWAARQLATAGSIAVFLYGFLWEIEP